jgi:hypothetical protein
VPDRNPVAAARVRDAGADLAIVWPLMRSVPERLLD